MQKNDRKYRDNFTRVIVIMNQENLPLRPTIYQTNVVINTFMNVRNTSMCEAQQHHYIIVCVHNLIIPTLICLEGRTIAPCRQHSLTRCRCKSSLLIGRQKISAF